MTLTQLEKDIQTMSFNLGQVTLIDNILSETWENADELLMFIKVWKTTLDKETDKVNEKYEGLRK
tara:strand:+ start:471 stop:665 length:195 start_codon:yes stop_codon:yes gene_type:complete